MDWGLILKNYYKKLIFNFIYNVDGVTKKQRYGQGVTPRQKTPVLVIRMLGIRLVSGRVFKKL
jgi:hypothetical protein